MAEEDVNDETGAEDSTEVEDEAEDETEETTEGTGEGTKGSDNGWKPPTKAEWLKTQIALEKANKESQRRRLALKELQTKAQAGEDDAAKTQREAAEAAVSKFKPLALRSAAKAGLLEAGAKTDRVAALSRLVDYSDIDVDDDGEPSGLDAQVEQLKTDYPEFFMAEKSAEEEKKPEKPRPPKVDTSGRPPKPAKQKSPGEIVAAMFSGQS